MSLYHGIPRGIGIPYVVLKTVSLDKKRIDPRDYVFSWVKMFRASKLKGRGHNWPIIT